MWAQWRLVCGPMRFLLWAATSKLRLFLREREPHMFEGCFECLFHVVGCCLCAVTQHHEIIGVADVEEIAFSLFSSPSPLGVGELQGLGFHILVHCIEVYVGQEGAHYSPYKVANFFFRGPHR